LLTADRADPVLVIGQVHVAGVQTAEVDPPPIPPIFPQTCVVGRGHPFDQPVSLDLKPTELQQVVVTARLLVRTGVAEYPAVLAFRVQPAPVAPTSPCH